MPTVRHERDGAEAAPATVNEEATSSSPASSAGERQQVS
jgi:hypothetical protein